MSTIEIAALIAGFVMAIARLARVVAPLWNYGPSWVQPLLTTLPIVLTQLGGALGAVETKLDLTEALLVGALTIAAAVRGAVGPQAALVLLVAALSTATACASAPEVSARDSYRAALAACVVYDASPADARTPEADKACAELRAVCE
jgi:hypothetical protein